MSAFHTRAFEVEHKHVKWDLRDFQAKTRLLQTLAYQAKWFEIVQKCCFLTSFLKKMTKIVFLMKIYKKLPNKAWVRF